MDGQISDLAGVFSMVITSVVVRMSDMNTSLFAPSHDLGHQSFRMLLFNLKGAQITGLEQHPPFCECLLCAYLMRVCVCSPHLNDFDGLLPPEGRRLMKSCAVVTLTTVITPNYFTITVFCQCDCAAV